MQETYQVGDLVHYATILSGPVPCKVIAVNDDGRRPMMTLQIIEERDSYPVGHTIAVRRGNPWVSRG